jgi:Transposase IS116/IS110/IS902 family
VLRSIIGQIRRYDRQLRAITRSDETATRLMTAPGIGHLSALAFISTIEDPKRFRRSTDVGAYLGLVPRVHQSGEIDRMGRITKAGDNLTRSYLVEAANPAHTDRAALPASGVGSQDHATGRAEEGPGGRCPEACDDAARDVDGRHRIRVEVRNGLTSAFPGSPRGGCHLPPIEAPCGSRSSVAPLDSASRPSSPPEIIRAVSHSPSHWSYGH